MALGGKKISFGFSKISKQNSPLKRTTVKEKIQYVDCLDSKTIVCKEGEDVVKEENINLVIPLKRTDDKKNGNMSIEETNEDAVKDDTRTDTAETENTKEQTLDEKAINEILEDAKKFSDVNEESESSYLVILNARQKKEVSIESNLDDYENVPIGDFGMAMLRGMGWEPGKGTNKSGRICSANEIQVRPRGMGLGADKRALTTVEKAVSNDDEELKVATGAYVQVTSGSFKGHYGQIEGFINEDSGRIIIKLAMKASSVSLNEYAFKLVTKGEYDKNSRVLNVSKYEEYRLKSEKISESRSNESDRKQNGDGRNSADNMSDSEKRRHRTEDKNENKSKRHRSGRSSEERSDDSDRRWQRTEQNSENRNDSESERHRTGRSSDDSDRKQHKTERNSENRNDSESKRHRAGRSSEERSDDSDRRRHRRDRSPEVRNDSEKKKYRRDRNSEDRSYDSDRKRHRRDRSPEYGFSFKRQYRSPEKHSRERK